MHDSKLNAVFRLQCCYLYPSDAANDAPTDKSFANRGLSGSTLWPANPRCWDPIIQKSQIGLVACVGEEKADKKVHPSCPLTKREKRQNPAQGENLS